MGDFALTIDDPPICSVGFMPPSPWRSPDDPSDIDTPDGLYCKLPQDSPMAVRGARNYPCMGHPGKRAPTVEICNSDKPFMPLAMRQHTLGPYPLDPNLLAQGVPPDDRVTGNDRIFGPVQGTPLPPGAVPRGAPAGPRGENPPPGTVGAAVPPVPSSGPRLAPISPMSAELPPFAPLDVPLPGELAPPPPRHPSSRHRWTRSTADSPRLRQARSEPRHLSLRPRSWWQSTIRTPVVMSVRTGSSTSSRICDLESAQDVEGHASHLKPP